MRSKIVAAFVLVVASLVAVPAFAKGAGKASFPMPAAAFKARVDAKNTKAKERMEAAAQKLTPEQAKELRAKFDAGTVQINAEVAKATADGTVTAEEAKKVREVARSAHPHGKGGHGHGKGKRAKKS